jgi:hypothetical protein
MKETCLLGKNAQAAGETYVFPGAPKHINKNMIVECVGN